MKKIQSGFTLIEIAIVLVIIGLLLGGVLKGQEMMTNAKIKRVVNDFNGLSAAVYSYMDRYNSLPGDDPNANTRWGATAGDSDGIVDGTMFANNENRELWNHLRLSGLITGTGNSFPLHAFGSRIGIEDTAGNPVLAGTVICMEQMLGKHAEIIDFQLDDGDPDAGELVTTNAAGNYAQATLYTVCKRL